AAAAQPPAVEPVQHAAFTAGERLGTDWNSHVESAPYFHTEEAGGSDADNREGLSVKRHLLADDRRVSAELALPERVADDCSGRAAPAVVVRGEYAPEYGADAEHIEEVSAHPNPLHVAARAAGGEVKRGGAPGQHLRECLLPVPDLLPLRIGYVGITARELAGAAAGLGCNPDRHQLSRGFDWQRPQQHRIDQLKDCYVGAYAQGKR